jgi:ribonuclease Z
MVSRPQNTWNSSDIRISAVSSTLLEIPGLGGVLLDAGEGTLGQMRRRFGTAGMAEQIYPNLKIIFISHMHADHHLGLRLVLEDRLKVCEK